MTVRVDTASRIRTVFIVVAVAAVVVVVVVVCECDGLGNIECLYTLNTLDTDVKVERCFRYLDQEVRCPLWSCRVPVTNVNSKYDFMIVTVQFLSDLKVILWCDLIMTAGTMIQLKV